ncbi:MAG: hypothetical protein FWE32_00700 [Oscillospiraceae bacterium]|nr:hypothetical protein [Oscillospiraceae bacterium]
MSKAVWFISYKLVEGASECEFLAVSQAVNDACSLSKRKGFISWQVLKQGGAWVDLVTWETMEDAIAAENDDGQPDPVAAKFYSFIDPESITTQLYSIEQSY